MTDGEWIGLKSLEAKTILSLVESAGTSLTPAGASAAEKIRKALQLTGSDPKIEIHVFCSPAERSFLEGLQRDRGGFWSSC